jgi:Flp pilus assembly protein TadD
LQALYRKESLPAWVALAQNPRTPPDILAQLATKPDDNLLQWLAMRTDLSTEMLDTLINSEYPGVRTVVLRQHELPSQLLHEAALRETEQGPLAILARMTNLTENIYFTIAGRGGNEVLLHLAQNPAVPETVLLALLENGNDQLARTVLNHPNARLDTRKRALQGIQRRHPGEIVRSAVLPEDYEQDGSVFMAHTEIRFHYNGRVSSGTLAKDSELDTRELNKVLFRKGQIVAFNDNGKVTTAILFPATIHGIPCRSAETNHRDGFPSAVILDHEYTYKGTLFAAGTHIRFHPHGAIRSFQAPVPTMFRGILCAAGKSVTLHDTGELHIAHIDEPHEIGGVRVPGGQGIVIDASGRLQATDASNRHVVAAKAQWKEGNLPLALGECIKALAAAPGNVEALYLKGFVLLDMQQNTRAHDIFSQAIGLQPESRDAAFGLGIACARMGNHDEAIIYWTRYLERENDIAILYNRAISYSLVGKCAAALADYNQLYRINPEYISVPNNLAWLLATCHDASLRNGRRAVMLAQEQVERKRTWFTLDTLAAAYAEQGTFKKAVKLQTEALDLLREQGPQTVAGYLEAYQARLQSYRNRKPWRDPCGTPQIERPR